MRQFVIKKKSKRIYAYNNSIAAINQLAEDVSIIQFLATHHSFKRSMEIIRPCESAMNSIVCTKSKHKKTVGCGIVDYQFIHRITFLQCIESCNEDVQTELCQ